jgi:hypothetical protein
MTLAQKMKLALVIALSIAAHTGLLCAEQSDWEIVEIEASKGRPGYLEVMVRNTSKHSLELVRHWPFGDMVLANVCFLPKPTPEKTRFIAHPGMTLIAQPCHYPDGWDKYTTVGSGKSVKALLFEIGGLKRQTLGLVLTERKGKLLVGPLVQRQR